MAVIVINHIKNLNPPGRFLIDNVPGEWKEIPDSKAIVKTCQAFREHQTVIRKGFYRNSINYLCTFTEDEKDFILETFRTK